MVRVGITLWWAVRHNIKFDDDRPVTSWDGGEARVRLWDRRGPFNFSAPPKSVFHSFWRSDTSEVGDLGAGRV